MVKSDNEIKARRLRGDRPITKPENDLFGFAPFAEHIARAIDQRATSPGLVVGVLGEWGTGKTSVLHMIEHYLRTGAERKSTTVIRFNPWWFSSSPEDLLRAFFTQLVAEFPRRTKALQKAREALAGVAGALSKASLGGWETAAAAIEKLLAQDNANVHELRREIERHLKNRRPRIVVIVDDLDRLPHEEVYQVFRLVKAVADFPRFTYVLAFDGDIVARALSHYVTDQGAGYIEKIVQVPFAMPAISRGHLNAAFFEQLQEVVGEVDDSERQRLLNLYYGGLQALIRSPRDISRFVDSVSVSYPALREEVDLVDFLALESLRVFAPSVHQRVAINPGYFGAAVRFQRDPKEDLPWHQEYLDALRPELIGPVKDILMRTFPHLRNVWSNISYSGNPQWRAKRRACSDAHFETYFRWALPAEQLRAADLQRLLAGNKDEVASVLDNHLTGDAFERLRRARILLDDLRAEQANTDGRRANLDLCRELLDRTDALTGSADPRSEGASDWPFEWLLDSIVHREVELLESVERAAFLRLACQESPSLATLLGFVNHLLLEHVDRPDRPAPPEGERLLTQDEVDELRQILRKRIQDHAEEDTLLALPLAGTVIQWWSSLDADACRKWTSEKIQDDQALVLLLRSLLRYSIVSTLGDYVGRPSPMISLKVLTEIGLDPSALRTRVETLMASLTKDDQLAARTFLRELDNPSER